MINKFGILNGAKYFSSGRFQNYLVFIPAKNALSVLVVLHGLICGNIMECWKKLLKIQLNQMATFVDHDLLSDINFNGHCLISNVSIPKKSNKSTYFLHTKSVVKKFKHRFYNNCLLYL